MSSTIEQKLCKLHHDPIKNTYMGLIDDYYFELSHDNYDAAKWECKVTDVSAYATPSRFYTYEPSPIKALSKAMKIMASEVTNVSS